MYPRNHEYEIYAYIRDTGERSVDRVWILACLMQQQVTAVLARHAAHVQDSSFRKEQQDIEDDC